MIYNQEECAIVASVLQRKTLERSIYNSMESLPLSFRLSMDCQLELDIKRCQAIMRIAQNDFSNVIDDVEILSPHRP